MIALAAIGLLIGFLFTLFSGISMAQSGNYSVLIILGCIVAVWLFLNWLANGCENPFKRN